MSIQSEINRISQNVGDSLTAVSEKGVTVPTGSTSDDLPGLIRSIQTGSNLDPAVDDENLLLDSTVDPIVVTPARQKGANIASYSSSGGYKITSSGLRTYYNGATVTYYRVYPGQVIYLKIPDDEVAAYMFQISSNWPPTSGTNTNKVGDAVIGAADDFITVPAGAVYILVGCLTSNVSLREVKTTLLGDIDTISKVTLPTGDIYNIRGEQTIPHGMVTSLANSGSLIVATVPGIEELKEGTLCSIYNSGGTVNSSAKLNVNGLGERYLYSADTLSSPPYGLITFGRNMLLIYSEHINGGCWLYLGTNTVNMLYSQSSTLPPNAASVANYISSVIPNAGTVNNIEITTHSGASTSTINSYFYTVVNEAMWFRVAQDLDGTEDYVVPSSIYVYPDLPPESEYSSDSASGLGFDHYVCYSEMFYNGYYEFQFDYNDNQGAWAVIWYFRTITVQGAEMVANKVTSLSSTSTDTEYPSAKCVYDIIGDIESALNALR